MKYNGHNWVNDGPPAINAENLNEMDNEIVYVSGNTDALIDDNVNTKLYTGEDVDLNITERDIYKNAYIQFPIKAGKKYGFFNKADSVYVAIYTTNNKDTSHDIETISAGMNANRTVWFIPSVDAKYLRIWCNGLPAKIEIKEANNLSKSIQYVKQANNLATANSVNKFNKDAATDGVYISESGALYNNALYCVSDFIPISNGETIYTNSQSSASQYYALYDENFLYIPNSTVQSTTKQITGTAESKYARFTFNVANKNIAMIYNGVEPNKYIPYNPSSGYDGYEIKPKKYFTSNDAMRLSKMNKISTTFTQDKLFEADITGAETSDYIEIDMEAEQYYFVLVTAFSEYYDIVRFYDKDKNIIGRIKGGQPKDGRYRMPLKLVFPNSCQFLKFAQYANAINNDGAGLYKGYFTSFENSVSEIVSNYNTENNNVLWIGTSIPEGATYPAVACKANGYNCINKSLGSSKLCFEGTYQSGTSTAKGKRLTATVAELEALYRQDVTDGIITEATLTMWKNYSYENSIIPYIDGTNETQVSMIVLDHGFNDRSTIYNQMQDVDNIDWSSDDRSLFTGAFKYLLDKIQEVNPFIKIVISGYFTNTVTRLDFSYNGPQICEMQALIGSKYDISVMKAWEHSQISNKYIAGSSDYIDDFNQEYGKSYSKITPDANGNITSLQLYCPDGMHPHSDLTGNCNKRLNAVYTKLLAHMI